GVNSGYISDFKSPASDFRIFGGLKAVVRPVPIPNTAVKRSVADGSGFIDSARVGSRQFFQKKPEHESVPAFLFPRTAAVLCRSAYECKRSLRTTLGSAGNILTLVSGVGERCGRGLPRSIPNAFDNPPPSISLNPLALASGQSKTQSKYEK